MSKRTHVWWTPKVKTRVTEVLNSGLPLNDPLVEALVKSLDIVHTLKSIRVYCERQRGQGKDKKHLVKWSSEDKELVMELVRSVLPIRREMVEDLVKRIDVGHSYEATLKYCQRTREVS